MCSDLSFNCEDKKILNPNDDVHILIDIIGDNGRF